MTWGWSPRGSMQASQGGARGTPAEAAQTKAWPSYEAEYLENRLGAGLYEPSGKYAAKLPDDAARAVYLDKVTENYKEEADECLKAEFKDWLEGRHEDNVAQEPYVNRAGAPARRYTYHTDIPLNSGGFERKAPGDLMENGKWKPTWWGKDSLTHLPGVRDFLRGEKKAGWENDFQMNMLAEHGPQDVEQAWQYFKHWVKGRPMTDAVCLAAQQPPISDVDVNAGRVGPINHMRTRQSWAGGQEPPEPPTTRDLLNVASAAAAASGSVSPASYVTAQSIASFVEGATQTDDAATQTDDAARRAAKENDEAAGDLLKSGARALRSVTKGAADAAGAGGNLLSVVSNGITRWIQRFEGESDQAFQKRAIEESDSLHGHTADDEQEEQGDTPSQSTRASSDLQQYPPVPRRSERDKKLPRVFGVGGMTRERNMDSRSNVSA